MKRMLAVNVSESGKALMDEDRVKNVMADFVRAGKLYEMGQVTQWQEIVTDLFDSLSDITSMVDLES